MTDRNILTSKSTGKKEWRKPKVRAVVPASHTKAGPFAGGPREDAFYRIS
jgi:hypothetical protein